MQIIPAILPKSYKELEEKAGIISGLVDFVQIDICDGNFVSNKTWPLLGDNGEFKKIVSKEMDLPFSDKIDYEIHLLTKTPIDEVSEWVKAGARRIYVHIENGADSLSDIIDEWGNATEIGIAIGFATPLSALSSFLDKVDSILLMSISEVGFQGREFEEGIYERIKELRKMAPDKKIAVDGGVNLENAIKLMEVGVDRLVVGSAIWESEKPEETLKDLANIRK